MRRLGLTICLTAVACIATAEPPPLSNNPFARPPTLPAPDGPIATDERSATPLRLVATMVGGGYGIANVEGRVLRPGDEIRGYRLKRVFEDRAVFTRNENDIVVYVKPEMEEEDETLSPRKRRR